MNILFLSHYFYPNVGGIETVSDILTHAFHNAGHKVHVMTWTANKGDRTFPFVIIRNPSLLQILKEHFWADLVFENNPAMRLGWPRLLFGRKTIIGLQTWIEKQGTVDPIYFFKTRYLASANKVIACSHAIRRQCWEKAIVIENPYQDSLFRILPLTNKTKEFIFLGRLVSDKGPELAIKALANLNKAGLQTKEMFLTITGEGEEKPKLQQLVKDLGLEKSINFTGSLSGERLVEILNMHRFILIPSTWNEPFGIVALEGMACGCVPIASNKGGLQDAIGNAGLTFLNGSVDELALCMKKILVDRSLENDLRTKAPVHLFNHTVSHVCRKYLEEIEYLQ